MLALVGKTGESSSMSQLDGSDIVYMARVPVAKIIAISVQIGTRFPAPATSMGHVLLADLTAAQLDAALPHFEAAVRLNPQHHAARIETGLLHLTRRRPGPAAEQFRAVLRNQPSLAAAHVGLGRAAEQLGQTAEATAAFERAIALTSAA
jgi:tetratricopeptide (TPR) repeat protein